MAHGYGYRSEQRLRKENQDTFGVFDFDGFQVVVVCDGMGGHVGGRQASSIAVRTIHDEMKDYSGGDLRGALRRAIEAANRAIYEMARKNYRLMGMGTTCVAAAIVQNKAHIAHVGDSRAYLWRDGNIRAVTRDHTMVNLFVDAELLSPEDAATHPEAHVLSRSLGVERQVEVELQEPIDIQTGDRLLLCSDGVHGVTGSNGLGNVDWANPQEGVDAVISAVEAANGDDNATLAVYALGVTGTSSPPTTPPDLASLEEEARQSAPPQPATPAASRPTLVPSAPTSEPVMTVESVPTPNLRDQGTVTPAAGAVGTETPTKDGSAKPNRSGRMRVLGLGVLAAIAVFVGYRTLSGGGDAPAQKGPIVLDTPSVASQNTNAPATTLDEPVLEPDEAYEPSPEDALLAGTGTGGLYRERCLDCTGTFGAPSPAAYLSSANDPDVAIAFFAPEVPPAPRRVPNTTSIYDSPPPSGPEQTKAVRAARNKRCREALDTVREAIHKSIDYASLYSAAWYCFNDSHTNALSRARAATFEDFKPLIAHFEGERAVPAMTFETPEEEAQETQDAAAAAEAAAEADGTEPAIEETDSQDDMPTILQLEAGITDPFAHLPDVPDTWSVAAAGGIEYRLALFEIDGDVQGFRDIMTDLLGEATVADHLAVDILLEATAAAAVARMEEPTPEALQAWARRVYVASRAMTGPVGELVRAHRPELAGMIEALLFEATGGDEGLEAIEDGYANDAVPPVVARAQAAGLTGQMPEMFGVGTGDGGSLIAELERAQRTGEVEAAPTTASRSRRGASRSRRGSYSRSRSTSRAGSYRDPSTSTGTPSAT